jgi:hypothetical protein
MQDCGSVITEKDIKILTNMGERSLQSLVLFPRALDISAEEHYIDADALNAIYVCRDTHPHLCIYLKSEDTGMLDSSAVSSNPLPAGLQGVSAGHCNRFFPSKGQRDYHRLVSLGHIAAFRGYDEQQLLPQSYFDNY